MKRPAEDGQNTRTRKAQRPNKNVSASAMAKEALRKVNKLAREVESKAFDNVYAGIAGSTSGGAGTIQLLSPITQGDQRDNREGDVIVPTKLEFNYLMQNVSASSQPCVGRIIIFQARTDFTPTLNNVLEYGTNNVQALYAFETRRNYTVLYDELINLQDYDTGSVQAHKVVCFPKSKIEYRGTSTTADSGNIWAVMMSNQTTAVANVQYTLVTRLWFKDA